MRFRHERCSGACWRPGDEGRERPPPHAGRGCAARCAGVLAAAVVAACATARPAAEENMDELLVVGRIYTFDREQRVASAVLVRGDKLACVGSADECARRARPGVHTVDLGAGVAVPGLGDAHGHVLWLRRSAEEVQCTGAASEAECARRAAERAKALPPGTWVRGRGWDQNLWPGARFPVERTLSSLVPRHPVALTRVDGHAIWVNARALEAAGIGRATPEPHGGRIHRYPDGRPSGVLVDNAADLVFRRIPPPSPEETERLLRAALADLVRLGLTAVHDAGVDGPALEAYRRLAAADQLPLRVYAMIDGQSRREVLESQMALWARTPEVGRLTVRSVKMFADGALGSRGAALFEPYADDPRTTGLLVTAPEELRQRVLRVAQAGFQPAVHAIGDRACFEVLQAFTNAGRTVDLARLRPRVEHLQVLRRADVSLLRDTGAVASMQPAHATSDSPWAEERLGRGSARIGGAYAWREVLAAGVPLAFGSDFPVESPDPRIGLFAAETRRPSGRAEPWMPEQRLTRAEAMRAHTSGVAYAALAEQRRGSLEVGFDADLTAFDRDVVAARPEELLRAQVILTIVGGRVEYRR